MNRRKIRWLFHKSRLFDGHPVGQAISFWTGIWTWFTPSYDHCEVWTQETLSSTYKIYSFQGKELCTDKLVVHGTCWTSTMRGEHNGVVNRPASDILRNPGNWHYVEQELTPYQFETMEMWMNDRVADNKGYDKPAISKFFNPFKRESDWVRFVCSEFCQGAAFIAQIFNVKRLWSPRRLWKKLVKKTHLPTYDLATGKMIHDGYKFIKE